MIKFRQKEFVAPLAALGVLSNGAMLASVPIGIAQANKAEEQAKAQEDQIKKQNQILKKIANNAQNNPEVAQQVASVKTMSLTVKRFAAIGNTGKLMNWKNIKGLGSDLWGIAKNNKDSLISGVLIGGVGAGASYATNKAIEYDMKKNGIPLPNQQAQQKQYAAVNGSVLQGIKSGAKTVWNVAKNNKLGILGFGVGLSSLPTGLGYLAEREQLKAQAKQSQGYPQEPQQKQYAAAGGFIKGLGKNIKGIKNSVVNFAKDPITGTTNAASHMLGMGGKQGVQNFANTMSKSENPLSQKIGEFTGKHGKIALAASVPVGLGVMNATWGGGEKAVRGTAKLLDKNAYAYDNSKNQTIQ